MYTIMTIKADVVIETEKIKIKSDSQCKYAKVARR